MAPILGTHPADKGWLPERAETGAGADRGQTVKGGVHKDRAGARKAELAQIADPDVVAINLTGVPPFARDKAAVNTCRGRPGQVIFEPPQRVVAAGPQGRPIGSQDLRLVDQPFMRADRSIWFAPDQKPAPGLICGPRDHAIFGGQPARKAL